MRTVRTMASLHIERFTEGVRALVTKIRAKFNTRPDDRMGVRTGFSEFDQRTRGFLEGKLYVAGARPGVGKTSWVTTIMANIAMSQPEVPVLMFSTELEEDEVLTQVIEAYAGAVPVYPNGRKSTDEEIDKLEGALTAVGQQVNECKMKVIHERRLTIPFINETITRWCDGVLGGQVCFVIIDQASRIKRDDTAGHGYALATEDMLNSLEVMAGDQRCPILLITQLNRMTELQKHATMANLKHSGAFEEFAHAVYLLEKDQDHGQRKAGSVHINYGATVHVAKTRTGRVGPINFHFFGEAHTWREAVND